MENKDQLRKIALSCSQYRISYDSSLRSEGDMLGETIMTCENCKHFTSKHQCELDLIDEILSNMDVKLD